MSELIRTKDYDIDGFKVTVRSFNRPDPHVAAKAILPLILELWEKKGDKNNPGATQPTTDAKP